MGQLQWNGPEGADTEAEGHPFGLLLQGMMEVGELPVHYWLWMALLLVEILEQLEQKAGK